MLFDEISHRTNNSQKAAHSKILVKDADLDNRLALVKSVSVVLTEALRLLGVQAPSEM